MSVISPTLRARVRSSIEAPIGRFFGRLGFTPNALTLIGFGIAVAGACFAAVQSWLIAGLVVAFGAIFDLFDGALARATGRTSRLGAFLDSTFDRAGEAVVYIGIAIGCVAAGFGIGAVLAAAAMAAAFLVSYTRAKADSLDFSAGPGLASVGLAPREIRVVVLVLGLILAEWQGGVATGWLAGSLLFIAILAAVTALQRIYFVYRQSKTEPNHGKEND